MLNAPAFYLIIIMWSNGPAAVPSAIQTGPFATQQACEAVKGQVLKVKEGAQSWPSLRAFCVSNGVVPGVPA